MKTILLMTSCLALAACGIPPERYRDGRPLAQVEVQGQPGAVASCMQRRLSGRGWQGVQVAETDLGTAVTVGSAMDGVLNVASVDRSGPGRVLVQVRGLGDVGGRTTRGFTEAAEACSAGGMR